MPSAMPASNAPEAGAPGAAGIVPTLLRCRLQWFASLAAALAFAPVHAAGDVARGAQVSRACLACHSLTPGQHLTGPSLAGVWDRRAGTAMGFTRYLDALKSSKLVWDARTLDAWLADPAAVVPGTTMSFRGINDTAARADLLAYLKAVSEGAVRVQQRSLPDLKRAGLSRQVKSIQYCDDSYRLTMADGSTHQWWEFNLRFKTDGSADGPAMGKPVVVRNGMQGDRAAVVFARPEDISAIVRRDCPR